MGNILSGLGLKTILTALGGLGAFLFYLFTKYKAKQAGRNEIITQDLKLNYQAILDYSNNKERIDREARKLKNCVPNDITLLDELRTKKGITTLSEAAATGVCESVSLPDGPDKTPDAS